MFDIKVVSYLKSASILLAAKEELIWAVTVVSSSGDCVIQTLRRSRRSRELGK